MLFSAVVDFGCGQLIEKGWRKLGLTTSIIANLTLLGVFKYFNFGFENYRALLNWLEISSAGLQSVPTIALPIGISFYTFQTMSYSIDVYRGEVKASKNFIEFGTYVTLFPQLVAGPIVRYATIQEQLKTKNLSVDNFSIGIKRFVIGLAKKMIIANSCASVADMVFDFSPSDLSTLWAWTGIIAYALQIYFDFSGYSDMAIGLGKMLGFDFLENFNYPYISKSIQEFWRRWHISLSTWFRDYLYISLGGNRRGNARTYLNLVVVFAVTGLWHGASWNFVFWGLFHGSFLILERVGLTHFLERVPSICRHIYVLLVVLVGWVFFRADDFTSAVIYLSKMVVYAPGTESVNSYLTFFGFNGLTILGVALGLVFSTPIYTKMREQFASTLGHTISNSFEHILLVLLFVITLTFVAADSYNPFIYFRF